MVHSDDKRSSERELTRANIQAAALACFSEKGLAGATMAEIAGRAGVSPGALYLHFKSKHELFESLGRPDLDQPAARVRERRAQIIAAAVKTFSEKGYAAATMDEIGAAVGLSKAALYGHFGSKEELFLAAVRDAPLHETVESMVHCCHDSAGALTEPDSPAEFFEQVATAYLESNRDPQRLELMRFILSESMRDAEVAVVLADKMIDKGSEKLASMIESFGFGPPEELKDLAQVFIGMLFAWVLQHRVLAGAKEADSAALIAAERAAAKRLSRVFVEGLTSYSSNPPVVKRGSKRKS